MVKLSKAGKPIVELVGENGNIYNLVALAMAGLREAGQKDKSIEMKDRVFSSHSYSEALGIIAQYVDEPEEEDMEEEDPTMIVLERVKDGWVRKLRRLGLDVEADELIERFSGARDYEDAKWIIDEIEEDFEREHYSNDNEEE